MSDLLIIEVAFFLNAIIMLFSTINLLRWGAKLSARLTKLETNQR